MTLTTYCPKIPFETDVHANMYYRLFEHLHIHKYKQVNIYRMNITRLLLRHDRCMIVIIYCLRISITLRPYTVIYSSGSQKAVYYKLDTSLWQQVNDSI